jgi:outer membrane protein TolC
MMKPLLRFGHVSCVLALLVASPTLGKDLDEVRLDDLARAAARRFVEERAQTDRPRPALPTAVPAPNVELTLQEAEARALERNLDIAVERLNPQLQDLSLARIRAAYRPTTNSTIGHRAVVNPPTSQLNGGNVVQNDTSTYNTGVTQALPWGGGDLSLTFNNSKQVTSNIFANFNPTFNAAFNATLVQPLFRDLLIDGTRQQLRVTTISRDISEIQLRGTLATTLANVRNAYWELVYAVQAIEVARGSLDQAQRLVADNKARVEVGTMAPLDIVQAEAEAATRRQALVQAEATMRTAELALKRMIVNGTEDPLWRTTITPVDQPEFRREPVDVERAVRRSLDNRTDLAQARKTIDSNDVTMQFLRNQTLPAVDLTATYSAQGLGGTQFIRQGSGLGSSVIGTIPLGYSYAWRTLTGRDYPTWNLSLNVSYPIGASAAEAQHARARVQRNQSVAQLRALELQVATEVTNAALQVESSLIRYETALVARDLAETRLKAEESRFDVGLSTNFFVVQASRDLDTVRNSALRALLDYRRAVVDFERVQEAPASRGGGITSIQAGGF